MKTPAFAVMIIFLLAADLSGAAEAPHALGGFVLGESIEGYGPRLIDDTAVRLRNIGCVMEVDVVPPEGFESGSINYGLCAAKNRILRIKLKYRDRTPEFYKTLLSRYKQRFGDPDEWKGDPFHVVIAWKWYFNDRNNNKISLTLQHNTQDQEEKIGNSVKLTLSDQMAAENSFYRESRGQGEPRSGKEEKTSDWNLLIPR